MSNGYLKIYRRLFKHWLWNSDKDRPRTRIEAFLDLSQLAAFVPTKRLVNGKLIELEPGEIVASERFLSERWKWSRTKLRAFFDMLIKDQLIERRKDQGETVLILRSDAVFGGIEDDNQPEKEPAIPKKTIPPKNQRETEYKKDKKGEEELELSIDNLHGATPAPFPGFNRFWRLYPARNGVKQGKSPALNIWKQAKLEPQADAICAALERLKQTRDWQKDNGRYIPQARTFLNQKRWDDEITDNNQGKLIPDDQF